MTKRTLSCFKSLSKLIRTPFAICAIHSCWMMLLSWIWICLGYNLSQEGNIVAWLSIGKNVIFPNSHGLNYAKNFTFVDVSDAKKIVTFGERSEVITDRSEVADFLTYLNRNLSYEYAIVDIIFDLPTESDESVKLAIQNSKRVAFPAYLQDGKINRGIFPESNLGIASYNYSGGIFAHNGFLKTEAISEMLSLPALVYRKLDGSINHVGLGLVAMGSRIGFNRFTPELRILPDALSAPSSNSQIIDIRSLNLLLKANEVEVANEFFANKIVVIGNFREDLHNTVAGIMPGPLLLANIYLALAEGDNIITIGWLMFIFISFFMYSTFFFYGDRLMTIFNVKQKAGNKTQLFVAKAFKWSVGLMLISAGSYLLFGLVIDIMFLNLFILATQFLKDFGLSKTTR